MYNQVSMIRTVKSINEKDFELELVSYFLYPKLFVVCGNIIIELK